MFRRLANLFHKRQLEQDLDDELRAWLSANVPAEWAERRYDPLEQRFAFLARIPRRIHARMETSA